MHKCIMSCSPLLAAVAGTDTMVDNLAMVNGPKLFVGIDAGTSTTGFATAAMGSNIRFQTSYPAQQCDYCKNLSCYCMS